MMRSVPALALALALLGPGPAPAAAQAGDPNAPVTSADPEAALSPPAGPAAEVQDPVTAGLPERAAPPRTLRAYWHVFIAFALAWVLLFGYALSLGRRFARVDLELQRALSRRE